MFSKILYYLFFISLTLGFILIGFDLEIWARRVGYFAIAFMILGSARLIREEMK